MILLSYFSPLLCSNDFPKSWFSNETGDFRDKRTCASCQPLFVRERNMKRSHAFWGKTVRSVSCQWRASLRSHPTLPPPRNLGTGLCCLQPPNGRRHCWFHCRNERRESGIYLKYGLSLRLVAFFFFFFPYAKRQKAGFANCGGTVLRWEGEFPFRWYSFRSTRSSFRCCLRAPPPTIPLRDKGNSWRINSYNVSFEGTCACTLIKIRGIIVRTLQ